MEQIKNIEKYNSGMAKSIEDKLWFTQFLNQPQFDNAIIVDYGCGDGTLIRTLNKIFIDLYKPHFRYFGVDNNEKMLNIAVNKSEYWDKTYIYYSKTIPQLVTNRPKILILSSVLHEVFSYGNYDAFDEIKDFNPDYIFIRDMFIDESAYRNITIDISKVEEHELFSEFKNVNEQPNIGYKLHWNDIIEFLLKYRYKENWKRELYEEYLSIYGINHLMSFFDNYNIIYKKQYILPFLKEQVMKDFGINLVDNTHINLILKRK